LAKSTHDWVKKSLANKRLTVKGIVAIFLFSLIIIVFIFTGYTTSQFGDSNHPAVVGSRIITLNEYRRELERVQNFYRNIFQGQIPEQFDQGLSRQALDQLVNREVIFQAAQKMGIFISDEEVRKMIIEDQEVFQEEGRFRREKYLALLEANGWTPAEFERLLRKERTNERARGLFQGISRLSKPERSLLEKLSTVERNVEYVRINLELVKKRFAPKEAEIQAELSKSDFLARVQARFDAKRMEWTQPERVRASHILFRAPEGDEEALAAALKKAQAARQGLTPQNFAQRARELSEDEFSKVRDGSLGEFSRGQMVPEFEQVAFTLAPGSISSPVKSPFGYHLIWVQAKLPASEPVFEDKKFEIASVLMAEPQYQAWLSELGKKLQASDFSGVEKELLAKGFTWQETGFVSLDSESIPGLNSVNLRDQFFRVNASRPWVPQVIPEGEDHFVFRFKGQRAVAAKTDPASKTQMVSRWESSLFELNFQNWLTESEAKLHVERNKRLISLQ
jgi:peptidyl-prolyl cis-trans isomerase D